MITKELRVSSSRAIWISLTLVVTSISPAMNCCRIVAERVPGGIYEETKTQRLVGETPS